MSGTIELCLSFFFFFLFFSPPPDGFLWFCAAEFAAFGLFSVDLVEWLADDLWEVDEFGGGRILGFRCGGWFICKVEGCVFRQPLLLPLGRVNRKATVWFFYLFSFVLQLWFFRIGPWSPVRSRQKSRSWERTIKFLKNQHSTTKSNATRSSPTARQTARNIVPCDSPLRDAHLLVRLLRLTTFHIYTCAHDEVQGPWSSQWLWELDQLG